MAIASSMHSRGTGVDHERSHAATAPHEVVELAPSSGLLIDGVLFDLVPFEREPRRVLGSWVDVGVVAVSRHQRTIVRDRDVVNTTS